MRDIARRDNAALRVRWRSLANPRNLFLIGAEGTLFARSYIPAYLRPAFDALIVSGLSAYGALKGLWYYDNLYDIPGISNHTGPEVQRVIENNIEELLDQKEMVNKRGRSNSGSAMVKYKSKDKYNYGTNGKYSGSIGASKRSYVKTPRPCYISAFETRNTATDPDGMYIGCGPNLAEITKGICHSIYHALLSKVGIEVVTWDSLLQTAWRIRTFYYVGLESTTTTFFDTDTVATDTHSAAVGKFITALNSAVGSDQIKFSKIEIYVVGFPQVFMINPDNLYLSCKVSQNMLIQNRTLSGTTTVEADDDLTNNVSNNPLYCRYFSAKGNTFQTKTRSGVATLMSFNNDIIKQLLGAQILADRHIDNTKFINSKTSKSFVLDPGSIKKLKNSFAVYHNINWWLGTLRLHVDAINIASRVRVPIGTCAMIGIDKMLKATSDENPVSIGYELNGTYKFGYKLKSWKTPPSVFAEYVI